MKSTTSTQLSPRKLLEQQSHDLILQHALDPENTPLSRQQQEQYARVVQAAKLIDEYPDDQHLLALMKAKYSVGVTQLRKDIALAKDLFKSQHTFDFDLWHAWELKDQVELIKRCREKDDFKNWNAAKKHLRDIIGEKPAVADDPRRMEKNVFYIQVNNGTGQAVNIPLSQLRGLSEADRKVVLDSLAQPIEASEAEEIFNT